MKGASKVIAVSNTEAQEYKEMGIDQNKIALVPHGLDIESFNSLPTPGQFKRKNKIREKRLVLFLGRIHEIKGLAFLAESFSELVKEIEDVVLVVAGPDAGYEKELRELIKARGCSDRIKFTGYIGGEEKLSAYVDADMLVNPRLDEVFGWVPFFHP